MWYNSYGDNVKDIVNKLIKLNKSISTMESCTGGCIANAITNIEGSSEVFKFGAVTYSNQYKIKMGVNSDNIDKYTVYSIEVANDMSNTISNYTDSNYGIGITGKLNRVDVNNPYGKDNVVYISIYDRDNDKYYEYSIEVLEDSRDKNKNKVLELVIDKLNSII